LSLDILKLIVLCMEHVHISYDARIPKIIESVVDNKTTSAAGIKDSMVGVFNCHSQVTVSFSRLGSGVFRQGYFPIRKSTRCLN